jgi:hypothetical protein
MSASLLAGTVRPSPPGTQRYRKDAHDCALTGSGRREEAGARPARSPPLLHSVIEGVENRRDHEGYEEK